MRQARARGLRVSCETAPHYLLLCDEDLREEGRFKMNPPLRAADDRDELIRGIQDGSIDCIASDHAPHSAEEKSKGLLKSAMGVTGIELSLPAVYTYAVRTGQISFSRMIELMAGNPRHIFGIRGGLEPGQRADFTLVDFNTPFTVEPDRLVSMDHATPFAGLELYGKVMATFFNGQSVFINDDYYSESTES